MILLLQRHIANYRKGIYENLNNLLGIIPVIGKHGPKNNYIKNIRPNCEFFEINDFYPIKKNETFAFLDVITPIIKFRPRIIITESSSGIISNYLLFILKHFYKFKIILWGHGYDMKAGFRPKSSIKDRLRKLCCELSDAIIVYNETARLKLSQYVNPKKIFVACSTLDTNNLTQLKTKFEKLGKDEIKKELNLCTKYNLVYVGRFLKEKHPDILIDVLRKFLNRNLSITLHYIGDGEMDNILRLKAQNFKKEHSEGAIKIKFWGTISNEELLGKLLFVSDIMIIPQDLGLSAVSAFCFGLPIITQKNAFQGPEAEYLINNYNGFLSEHNNNGNMADKILNYLNSSEKEKKRIKENISFTVKNICSLDNFLNGFKEAIGYLNN
ncbi:MAG: glycosyltransferase [bacterium]